MKNSTSKIATSPLMVQGIKQQLLLQDKFIELNSGVWLQNKLLGKKIAIIQSANANRHDVIQLEKLVKISGGTEVSHIILAKDFSSFSNSYRLASVINNSIPAGKKLSPVNDFESIRAIELLSLLIQKDKDSRVYTKSNDTVVGLTALMRTGFIKVNHIAEELSDVTLFIIGDYAVKDKVNASFIAQAVRYYQKHALATVVAGRNATENINPINLLRSNRNKGENRFSTIDNLERFSGKLTTILALQAAMQDEFNDFGDKDTAQQITVT